MSFLKTIAIDEINSQLIDDKSKLGKTYRVKSSKYLMKNVDPSFVNEMRKDGWEVVKGLKTKVALRKQKSHNEQFVDDLWCQFYNLGYRYLNSKPILLPFGKEEGEHKQIDIIAIDEEIVFLIECQSSEDRVKAPSFTTDFEELGKRIDGFRKTISQLFGTKIKVKYVFATRNLRIDTEGEDIKKLKQAKSFYYNDNTYTYINSLLKSYKGAAKYQVLGLIFKNELINNDKIEIPAVEGDMGGEKYYMFSIEPHLLLKMGFILHRTKANESEMPTYQRLLVPTRLKGIEKFLKEGHYFPNSIILNFSEQKNKVLFEPAQRSENSRSRFGTLKIPNAYAIAYIIDGQHRVYGYANLEYKDTNTVPVVAFKNLSSIKQLEIFMEINQNQKAVSASLRLTLEEDLFWESDRADSRLKALRSSIVKELSSSLNGPLYNKIQIGEDIAPLTFTPFYSALKDSGLLPKAKGNKYADESLLACLYDTTNIDHNKEMAKAKDRVVSFINSCYDFVEERYNDIYTKEKYFILSNRGTYAFIVLLGSLNNHVTKNGIINFLDTPKARLQAITKYLITLLEYLVNIKEEEEEKQLALLGAGADIKWLRFFQSIINEKHSDYAPTELIDWKERQNEDLQDEGRKYGVLIEKAMKKIVLEKIKYLYKDKWELEINSIKRECQDRAEKENEKNYRDGLNTPKIEWTEMFNINDYKSIITKYWIIKPENFEENTSFKTFKDEFAIDINEGFHSKSDQLKWISYFNSHRNLWAHEGTKEKRLNQAEVRFLEKIYNFFYPTT